MRPDGQARRASISGIFERYAARMYRYIELRTLVTHPLPRRCCRHQTYVDTVCEG